MANFKSTQDKQTFDYNPADKSFKVAKGEGNKIVGFPTTRQITPDYAQPGLKKDKTRTIK